MNEEAIRDACEEIYSSLIDGIAPQQQLENLLAYYPVEQRDAIRDAFWEYFDQNIEI
jgi:hypothetical protein